MAAATVALAASGALSAPAPGTEQASARVLVDDFEDVSAWSAHPADGVELRIGSDGGVHGRSLRLDFRFVRGGGYAVARRMVALDLPENYRFRFALRGACLPNDLEFKLIDASGENVWWCNRRSFQFPTEWDSLSTRKRQIGFAWGPAGGGDIRHVAAIELAITAGSGGEGTVWIDDLTLEPLPPPAAAPPIPVASASSSRPGHAAERAVDRDSASAWWCAPRDRGPWLALDLGREYEFGGLVIDWAPGRHASDYDVEVASGATWRPLRQVRHGNGGRDYLYIPDTEAQQLRVRALGTSPAGGIAIREVTLQPLAWASSPERFFEVIAKDAPRGSYPRGISGEQPTWTLVGVDGGADEGLLSEDGMLETGKASFSIEPFLFVDGRLLTWSDVDAEQSLEQGVLPIPSVRWTHSNLALTITALASGGPTRSELWARYRVTNRGAGQIAATLFLAVRPFQVNPPSQFLNTPGGVAAVREVQREGSIVRVNGERGVASLTRPSGFGAATFDEGDIVADYLRQGRVPASERSHDPFGHASAAFAYRLELPPGAERDVFIMVPFRGPPAPNAIPRGDAAAQREFEGRLSKVAKAWSATLGRVRIGLPEDARDVEETLRAQLAWILINRDGPAIQPGSRSYERSWIRDGSLTSSALLRLGHADVVREFIEWFAEHQYENGKVPCCVDQRGADPVPEHDSHGEFIFLVAEYHRYTADRSLVESLWPRVAKAAAHLDSLRQTRRTREWRASDKRVFFGLLPPSISHEGYSAKPMHSYWDDFFALRGFKDAAYLAGVLGLKQDRARLAAIRDEFQRELIQSIRTTMKQHRIDYVPGCADLGDFDATSTTIALSPVGAEAALPPAALRRTFERYWEFFRDRRDGRVAWEAFTPYEIRNIGAFVRLGWRDRAAELLEFFMAYRTPPEWRQWPEVVGREARAPRFIGDLPHSWVGSDFVRSVLDLLAYEREADSALVIGAGIPPHWLRDSAGVTVHDLHTPHGKLGFTMRSRGDVIETRIDHGVRIPPGGIVVSPPLAGRPRRATVNGARAALTKEGAVVVRRLPATVVLGP